VAAISFGRALALDIRFEHPDHHFPKCLCRYKAGFQLHTVIQGALAPMRSEPTLLGAQLLVMTCLKREPQGGSAGNWQAYLCLTFTVSAKKYSRRGIDTKCVELQAIPIFIDDRTALISSGPLLPLRIAGLISKAFSTPDSSPWVHAASAS
jgi:hypothetical protein